MVILDVDFNEGDFLTAGVITSTSSVNGITTTVNSNTLTKMIYAGSDSVGSIASSTGVTTIATVLIPANTIYSGIIVVAPISTTGTTNDAEFDLKIGATSSEASKQKFTLHRSDNGHESGGSMGFVDTTQTWSADVTVLVTGQNTQNYANDKATCHQLIVLGF